MTQFSNRSTQRFSWLFIVVGLVAVSIGLWLTIKSLGTKHWPEVDGVIQSAEMRSQSGGEDGGTTCSAVVTYTYQVAGASYTGGKISIGQLWSSSEYAHEILQCYPVGQKVSVHYAPGDPTEAVLETGIHGGTWLCFGVGTALTLFGIMYRPIKRVAARAQVILAKMIQGRFQTRAG